MYKRRDYSRFKGLKGNTDDLKPKLSPRKLKPLKLGRTSRKTKSEAYKQAKLDKSKDSYAVDVINELRTVDRRPKRDSPGLKRDFSKSVDPVSLPNRRHSKYDIQLQQIITACEKVQPSAGLTSKVSLEQQAVSKINKQLDWTTGAINRIQDTDAAMLEYLFGKLEEEQLDYFEEISEAKRYFKYANSPAKVLKMVSKLLRSKRGFLI
jgi:hypothetical protein